MTLSSFCRTVSPLGMNNSSSLVIPTIRVSFGKESRTAFINPKRASQNYRRNKRLPLRFRKKEVKRSTSDQFLCVGDVVGN